MQLTDLLDLLEKYVNDDSLDRWDDDTRIRYLNIWYKKILTRAPWYFLITTDATITLTPGTSSYSKPFGLKKIKGVWLDVIKPENKLGAMTRKMRESIDTTLTGRPRYYYLQGSNIIIYPQPDASYNLKIEAVSQVPDMMAVSDEPIFDSDYHYLIPLGAAASLKKTSGGSQINEGDNLIQEYLAGLDRMMEELSPGEDDRPLAVQDVTGQYQQDNFSYT